MIQYTLGKKLRTVISTDIGNYLELASLKNGNSPHQ